MLFLHVHPSQQSCHTNQVALIIEQSFPLTVFTSVRLGSPSSHFPLVSPTSSSHGANKHATL